jgi:hypothetical protein
MDKVETKQDRKDQEEMIDIPIEDEQVYNKFMEAMKQSGAKTQDEFMNMLLENAERVQEQKEQEKNYNL